MQQDVTLCLDFGNTRQKAAIFHGDVFYKEIFIAEPSVTEIEKIVSQFHPTHSILSSVIHHPPGVEAVLKNATAFHLLQANSVLPFTTPVGKPETIGADRLALAAAAKHFFPGKNNLIIALGSCITYNFINQNNAFLGGGISPGVDMRFKSMHDYTALLPIVQPAWDIPLVGYDTKTNLQSGVVFGIIGELDGMLQRYQDKYGNFNAVLTGGNSAYFAGQLKYGIFADPNFLYKGLYALSQSNQS